ncbi:MAG: hypothetical protein LBH44_08190 [Treponema sp.]|jgi:hypothetical protein|nr:hypothetical protein [Treponema sp.]
MLKKKLYGLMTIIIAIALVFAFAACDENGDDDDDTTTTTTTTHKGKLTITGLSEYDDLWIAAYGATAYDYIYAAGNVNATYTMTPVKITNGSAVLKVWKQGSSGPSDFTGSTSGTLFIFIRDSSGAGSYTDFLYSLDYEFGYVTFTNGVGTLDASDFYDDDDV